MSQDDQIIKIAEHIEAKNSGNLLFGLPALDSEAMWNYLAEFCGYSHYYFSEHDRFDQAWDLAGY